MHIWLSTSYCFRIFSICFHSMFHKLPLRSCSHDETEMLTKCWKRWKPGTNITNMKCMRETKQQPTNIGNVSLAVGSGPWTELFIVSLRALEVSLWFATLALPAMCSRPLRIHQQHGVRKNSPQRRHSSLAQLLKAWSNSVVANGFEANCWKSEDQTLRSLAQPQTIFI